MTTFALDRAAVHASDVIEAVLAVDRSVRSEDVNGFLHVKLTNISKANVCPYYGREIPGWERLGLDPDKLYQMWRHPDELAKAAPTLNNLPLMDEHIIVSADSPQKDQIAGTMGSEAFFDGTYLKNSMAVWVGESIGRIERKEQKELSSAYQYDPDMTPGEINSVYFDGIMRNIRFNHVALVVAGRAGPDVMVADSEIEERPMTVKRLTSKKALFAHGGIKATLAPLIAADAKPDIPAALEGVNRTNFKAMKATILKRLAKDAAITADVQTALTLALDAMEKEDCGEDDEMEAEDEDPDKKAEDEEAEEEEKKAKDKAAKDKAAKDKAAKDKAEDDAPKMTKASMDAAITAAVTKSRTEQRAEIMAEFNAIAAAKTEVMPLVGEVTAAMDSAIDVYKFALDHEGVSLDGTESLSALKTMVKMAADRSAPQVFIANDAKPGSAVTDMFPGLRRLRA